MQVFLTFDFPWHMIIKSRILLLNLPAKTDALNKIPKLKGIDHFAFQMHL